MRGSSEWRRKFFRSTRGQLVRLLRRRPRSAGELAEEVGLTENAVRNHLLSLERDRLVEAVDKRPGLRRPATVYGLTSEAETLFPRPYDVLLGLLLETLSEQLSESQVDRVLDEVGHRLAQVYGAPLEGDPQSRLAEALSILGDLGGLADLVEAEGGEQLIYGYGCFASAVTGDHPGVCRVAEVFLSELLGRPVRQRCEHHPPHCRFHLVAE